MCRLELGKAAQLVELFLTESPAMLPLMLQSIQEKEGVKLTDKFLPDELPGFEAAQLQLPSSDDGPLRATLIRRIATDNQKGPAVLYLHGFVDYFFQTHLAAAYEDAGFRFYALDLRRYGRSLRLGNRANTASKIDDYFTELTWALESIAREHGPIASLVAHSTGALTASLYAKRGPAGNLIRSLVLNSPFLAFNVGPVDLFLSRAAASSAHVLPHARLPQKLSSTYGKTLHCSELGEWDYDLKKKPLAGFPFYADWFCMIHAAQDEIAEGLALELPVLVLTSTRSSRRKGAPKEADFSQDIVLDVEEMKARARALSKSVQLKEIEGGIHDLTLSRKPARDHAISAMIEFSSKAKET